MPAGTGVECRRLIDARKPATRIESSDLGIERSSQVPAFVQLDDRASAVFRSGRYSSLQNQRLR
jgi:hypothetical protein